MARSTTVTIYNMTGFYFIKETATVVGHWEGEPTDINPYINKGLTENNKMIAKSVDTHANDGTGGTITYKLNNFKNAVYIHWDNPFWGNNSYSINVSDDMQKQYNIQVYHSEGKGNDASINIVLYQKHSKNTCLHFVNGSTPQFFITDVSFADGNIFFKVDGGLLGDIFVQTYISYSEREWVQISHEKKYSFPERQDGITLTNSGVNVTYDFQRVGWSGKKESCKIKVIYKELIISPDKIGTITKNISGKITASGCDGEMIFSAHGLPEGVTISADGVLSCATTEKLKKEIQVEVRNDKGNYGLKEYILQVN